MLTLAVVGFAFRLHQAFSFPVVPDEAFTFRITTGSNGAAVHSILNDVHPPLYYCCTRMIDAVVGGGIVWQRLFVVILGTLSIPTVYLLSRELMHSKAAGYMVATLIAVHPLQLDQTSVARMYSLGVLLYLLAALSFVSQLNGKKGWLANSYAYAVLLVCGLYTHYFVAVQMLCQHLALLAATVLHRGTEDEVDGALTAYRRSIVPGAILGVCGFVPWLPYFLRQATAVRESYWIDDLSLPNLSRAVTYWTFGESENRALLIPLTIGIVFLLGSALLFSRGRVGLFLCIECLGPWFFVIGIWFAFGRSILQARYLLFAQVPLFLLIGYVWSLRRDLRLPLAVLLVPVAYFSLRSLPMEKRGHDVMANATAFIERRAEEGDVAIFDNGWNLNLFRAHQVAVSSRKIQAAFTTRARSSGIGMDHTFVIHDAERLVRVEDAPATGRVWTVVDSVLPSFVPDSSFVREQAWTFEGRPTRIWPRFNGDHRVELWRRRSTNPK